jgi:hypothetical protein
MTVPGRGWPAVLACMVVGAGTLAVAPPAYALEGVVADITVGPVSSFPQFGEDITDYAIRCEDGVNHIDVVVDAPSATSITVDGSPASSGVASDLAMEPDDAAVVAVTLDGETDEYWYRCLPSDFPAYTIDRPGDPGAGYYFAAFGWARTGQPAASPYLAMLDTYGVPVWYKAMRFRAVDQKVLSDGTLAWMESGPGPRSYEIRTLEGELLQHDRTVGHTTDNHDLIELGNGNIMLMSYVDRPCVDLTVLGSSDCETAIDGYLQEIDPATGELIWEWRSQDHIPLTDRALGPAAGQIRDLVHWNSVDEFPDGDLLLSGRSAGVYRIDRTTGAVEWKLGGTDAPYRLTTVDDPFGGPWRQHDARVLDADTISLYDNQSGLSRARATVYDLDEGAGTARLVWEKLEGGTQDSFFIGAHRRQPDGHAVVTWGGISPFVEEVDPAGDRAFALQLDSQWVYRVTKIGSDVFSLQELRDAAGGHLLHDAPTDVLATPGNHSATVGWTPPPIGAPSSYEVLAQPGGATCTTTTTTCQVSDLEPGTAYTFTVTAQNSFGGSLASLPSNEVVVTAPLYGTVTDSTSGGPLPGATVRLYRSGTNDYLETSTGSTGTYAFADVPVAFYKVRFSAPNRETVWFDGQTTKWAAKSLLLGPGAARRIDQALVAPTVVLSGSVASAADAGAISGALVRVFRVGGDLVGEPITDETGAWEIELAPGFYKVEVSAAGYVTEWWDGASSKHEAGSVLVGTAGATGVDTTLVPDRGLITGTVTDAQDGAVVTGASVEVFAVGSSEVISTTTDALGQYVLDVPTGFHKLRITAGGYEIHWFDGAPNRWQAASLLVSPTSSPVADVVLQPIVGSVTGTVTDASSTSPVVGIQVVLWPTDGSPSTQTVTGPGGTFSFTSVRGGFYKLQFSGTGYETIWWGDARSRAEAPAFLVGAGTFVADQAIVPLA